MDFKLTITILLVIVTCLVSFAAFNNEKLKSDLIFYPPAVATRNQWYRFFSSGLIHADFMHLFFNMFALYLFGRFVEEKFVTIFQEKGKLLYLVMYVAALPVALLPTYAKNKDNPHYLGLGASGAVSAVVFAGLLIAPYVEVGLFFIPPFIPGFVFAPLYLAFSFYMDKKGGDNINHSAHIWGALFGLGFVIVIGKFLANYNAISEFWRGIQLYFQYKFG